MFWYHQWGMGLMMFGTFIVVVIIVWLVVRLIDQGTRSDQSPEAILKRRYARGEINREEYEQQLNDLRR